MGLHRRDGNNKTQIALTWALEVNGKEESQNQLALLKDY